MYRYCHKGPDALLGTHVDADAPKDEIRQHEDMRHVGVIEAHDKLHSHTWHGQFPMVMRLPVHLPGDHVILADVPP